MYIKNIKIKNFRNLDVAYNSFSTDVNYIIGKNGQGKTNLLEAIYLSATGNSFRSCEVENLIHFQKKKSYLSSLFEKGGLDYQIEVFLEANRKTLRLNGKTCSKSDLLEHFSIILFEPESLNIIKNGSEQRRNFVDELITTRKKKNYELLLDYKKTLKIRNKILRDHVEKKEEINEELMQSVNELYLIFSSELTYQRILALKEIQEIISMKISKYLFGESSDYDSIQVEYISSNTSLMNKSKEEIYSLIQKKIKDLYDVEKKVGFSIAGPHKHEVVFLHKGKDSRFYCSQGQQRTIILCFKSAQILYHKMLYGFYPVMMLDDVFSELDEEKKSLLERLLSEIDTQVFITSCEIRRPENFNKRNYFIGKIDEGLILNEELV